MLKRALPLVLVFSLAFNVAFAGVWAYRLAGEHGRQAPPPPGPWGPLKLTPQQTGKLGASWRTMGEQIVPLHAEAAKHREALLDLLEADKSDEKAILAEQARIDGIEEQIRQIVFKQMLETRDMLTAEQRAAWLQMMRTRGERFGWGRRRGGPRPAEEHGAPNGPRPGTRERRKEPQRP